jgi:hypothetical protein
MLGMVIYDTLCQEWTNDLRWAINDQYVQLWPSITNYVQFCPIVTTSDQLWRDMLGVAI